MAARLNRHPLVGVKTCRHPVARFVTLVTKRAVVTKQAIVTKRAATKPLCFISPSWAGRSSVQTSFNRHFLLSVTYRLLSGLMFHLLYRAKMFPEQKLRALAHTFDVRNCTYRRTHNLSSHDWSA